MTWPRPLSRQCRLLVFCFVVLPTRPAVGQWIQRSYGAAVLQRSVSSSPGPSPVRVGTTVLGAGAGGLLGAGFGLLAGAVVRGPCDADDCGLDTRVLIPAAAGGVLGAALGAHLGNGRRGSLGRDVVTGAGYLGAAALIVRGTGGGQLLLPIAPVVGVVVAELRSARRPT